MDRTPSPPRRLRTPPAPLHGPQHDSYEPFSPRRSSRVAASRIHHQIPTSPSRSRTMRAVTPTPLNGTPAASRTGLLAPSPPSSPISLAKHRTPRSTRRNLFDSAQADSDSDHFMPTPARRLGAALDPRGMLPTPAKTPRKRVLETEESLSSTARVLFANRPATIEEATPRKSRKSKHVYTLDSFEDREEEKEEKIEIYTDSKDRIPTRDAEEENPFITKKGKGKARSSPQRVRKVDPETAKMNDAVHRGEGMVYLFRGKKILRKYDDNPSRDVADDEAEVSDQEIRRQAGAGGHRPLTRSTVKPRLLFQTEIQEQRAQQLEDEEATTEIDEPVVTPRKPRQTAPLFSLETTPPPTIKPIKREISFDSWTRVKSSSRGKRAAKRSGEPLENPVDKRTRSDPSSSMSAGCL